MHLCCGLGGSLWTGAILGWSSKWAIDGSQERVDHVREQANRGYWPGLTVIHATLPDTSWHAQINGPVDLLAAGFSCKDISCAGSRAGLGGASTGPTYRGCLQAIDAFRPAGIFFENTPNIKKYRPTIWRDLRDRGYDPRDGVISAADVGAPHLRKRWFLLATRADATSEQLQGSPCEERWMGRGVGGVLPPTPNPVRLGLQESIRAKLPGASVATIKAAAGYCQAHAWNQAHSHIRGMVNGLAPGSVHDNDRRRRISGLGDAWVPLQAAVAFAILMDSQRNP